MQFRDFTDEELDQEWGHSGQTCREILSEYQLAREFNRAALAWFESLFLKREKIIKENKKLKQSCDRYINFIEAIIDGLAYGVDLRQGWRLKLMREQFVELKGEK